MSQPANQKRDMLPLKPGTPVSVTTVRPATSFTGSAPIAEVARIVLSNANSSDVAMSATPKGSLSESITGVADPVELPKSETSSWDSSPLPDSARISPPPKSSPANSTSSLNPKSPAATNPDSPVDMSLRSQLSRAKLGPSPSLAYPVTLTLTTDLWAHLLTLADGRDEPLDVILSEKVQELRDLYGTI